MKSQSAMEYLMTYGWAILVIAVVLAALYSLGIFNPSTFAPKASAGSCEVVRPFGPTTTTDIHLEGTCTNMLPKYVASFDGSSIIYSNISEMPSGIQQRTAVVWFSDPNPSQNEDFLLSYGSTDCITDGGRFFEINVGHDPNEMQINAWCTNQNIPYKISPNAWYFTAYAYNGTYQFGYLGASGKIYSVNGKFNENVTHNLLYIGAREGILGTGYGYANGMIANVQIYNEALSESQIYALYQEGIGGDPIDLQNLVAWYPLNGNANDYSGNDNNGKVLGTIDYSSTWYRTYSAP